MSVIDFPAVRTPLTRRSGYPPRSFPALDELWEAGLSHPELLQLQGYHNAPAAGKRLAQTTLAEETGRRVELVLRSLAGRRGLCWRLIGRL